MFFFQYKRRFWTKVLFISAFTLLLISFEERAYSASQITKSEEELEKRRPLEAYHERFSEAVANSDNYLKVDVLYKVLKASQTLGDDTDHLSLGVRFNRRKMHYIKYESYENYNRHSKQSTKPMAKNKMILDEYEVNLKFGHKFEEGIELLGEADLGGEAYTRVYLSHIHPEEEVNISEQNSFWHWMGVGQAYKKRLLEVYSRSWFQNKKKHSKIKKEQYEVVHLYPQIGNKLSDKLKNIENSDLEGFFGQLSNFPNTFSKARSLKPFEVFNLKGSVGMGVPLSWSGVKISVNSNLELESTVLRYEGESGPRLLLKQSVRVEKHTPSIGISLFLKRDFLKRNTSVSQGELKAGYILGRLFARAADKYISRKTDSNSTFLQKLLDPVSFLIETDLGFSWEVSKSSGPLFETYYDFDLNDAVMEKNYQDVVFNVFRALKAFNNSSRRSKSLKGARVLEKDIEITKTSDHTTRKIIVSESSKRRTLVQQKGRHKEFASNKKNPKRTFDLFRSENSLTESYKSYVNNKADFFSIADTSILYVPIPLSIESARDKKESSHVSLLLEGRQSFQNPDQYSIKTIEKIAKNLFNVPEVGGFLSDLKKYENSSFLNLSMEVFIPEQTIDLILKWSDADVRQFLHEYTIAQQKKENAIAPRYGAGGELREPTKPKSAFEIDDLIVGNWANILSINISYGVKKIFDMIGADFQNSSTETYLFYLQWKKWAETVNESNLTMKQRKDFLDDLRLTTHHNKSFTQLILYLIKRFSNKDVQTYDMSCLFLVESDEVFKFISDCFGLNEATSR